MAQPDWNAFTQTTCTGITLTPSLTSGILSYQLCLLTGATVNGTALQSIQGFWALGNTSTTTFTATDGSNTQGWTFGSKTNNGQVSGWEGLGSNRLLVPTAPGASNCATFTFGQFNNFSPAGSTAVPGIHAIFTNGTSGFFKCNLPAVPEPATAALAGMGGLFGAAFSVLRRKIRRG